MPLIPELLYTTKRRDGTRYRQVFNALVLETPEQVAEFVGTPAHGTNHAKTREHPCECCGRGASPQRYCKSCERERLKLYQRAYRKGRKSASGVKGRRK